MTDSAKNTPLVLVDGSSYLFRAYHAMPELTNPDGMPTGAIYGVVNMLRRLRSDYPGSRILVIFDSKGKTTRHSYYPDYKANRPEMPEDLAVQIEPLHQIIEAEGMPLFRIPGIEADDIIGTLARQASEQGQSVIISTGDKDMAQLVNEQVTLINTMTNSLLDPDGVMKKFAVRADQIIDYLALMGDSVDNIPGVPKVGPKTAAKWLAQYDSLDNIMAHADEFKGKVGEYLRDSLAFLPIAKRLVTIECDIDLPAEWVHQEMRPADRTQLAQLFKNLAFNRWLAEAQAPSENEIATPTVSAQDEVYDYHCVLTEADWQACLALWQEAEVFAFDTETTSLDAMQARLVGFSLSFKAGEAFYVPLRHDYLGVPEQLPVEKVLADVKLLLAMPKKLMIGQNLKYDLKILRSEGIAVHCQLFDTMLAAYVLDPISGRHDMDSLAARYLDRQLISFKDVAGTGKKQLTFDAVNLEQATDYAAEDAEVTLALYQRLQPELEKSADCWRVFSTLEMPLMPILMAMEYHGVLVDVAMLHAQGEAMGLRMAELTDEIFALAGEDFNIDSTKQLAEILYEKLQLPILKKTPKGAPSTAEPVLSELAHDYPLPKLLLEYRSLTKLKSTYIDKLPREVNPATGRVHTSYRQAVTSTGRLASNNPNLQNIPVRSEAGRAIRKAFVAPSGYSIISADYSQIELRIMAHLSQDVGLCQAFADGLDIHKATAAEIFGETLEEVTAEQRRSAKAINFGLIYGMSAFGLSKQLGIDRASAARYMEVYFARYPGVQQYMHDIREKAHEQGFVSTLFGRKLLVPDIHSKNKMRQNAAERAAINAPMQGTAADIIKLAMLNVQKWLAKYCPKAVMLMQVHDELVFECPNELVAECSAGVKASMENAAELAVPLIVDVGVGRSWEAAH